MKIKIITSCGLALIFLTTSLPAFALEATPSLATKKQVIHQQKEVQKIATQETKAVRQETRTDIKSIKLQFERKQISVSISKARTSIVSRYDRLLTDKAALQIRITERKAKGLNTTAAERKLASFSTTDYTAHLSAFDAQTALAIASTRSYAQSPELKSSFKNLNTDLLNLRKVLTETIHTLVSNKTN